MDYLDFCRHYFAVTQIPVSLLCDNLPVYSALGELLSIPVEQKNWDLFPVAQNPCLCALTPDLGCGRVHVEGTGYDVILGPVFSIPMTNELVHQFMREQTIPMQYYDALAEFMYTMPITGEQRFAHHLALIHQALNHKSVDVTALAGERVARQRQQSVSRRLEALENSELHNSYAYEMEMYHAIRGGNLHRLTELFNGASVLKEGKMASSPLRHARNICITTIVKSGMLGAIPGGLDVEKTYQLMDYYIQECERQPSIEAISNLQTTVVMDFCSRVADAQLPEGISPDIYRCVNYIRTHTNESIGVEDVAAFVHRSPSYVMKHFRQELGLHVGEYITRCKLEEAKSLLRYGDMSLADISNYLAFSSQSYFQNLFKKYTGVTPTQYRKAAVSEEDLSV